MIIYFSDRQLNILGHASTSLPDGPILTDDLKIEDVETGVASFECRLPFDKDTREQINAWAAVGNYILRSHESENEFYTIIEFEEDTDAQEVYIYAEDAGLDLLNEVVGPYEADKAYNIAHYIEKFAYDSGFVIGTNEIASLTRKLSWDGEATAAERIASVATQFDGCEVSYTFDVKGLEVTNKYINIHKERGKDIGAQLRLNKEIDRIITKKSIANLATGLEVTGGTPETEGEEEEAQPITLAGYKYDDGNFYVKGTRLLSREALKKWSRYNWTKEPNQLTGEEGHIIRLYSYDTTSQSELCSRAVSELKKMCEIEVNYEVDIKEFPENIKVGDRVNIIDDAGALYVSARLLRLDTSIVKAERTATIGEYIIKGSGISQKVADLAEKFAQSASRISAIANAAKTTAESAKKSADTALSNTEGAYTQASEAKTAAEAAQTAASEAKAKAEAAESAVETVENSVEGMRTTIVNAQAAAEQAQQAAATAETKATEAKEAATNAEAQIEIAVQAAGEAHAKAEEAIQKADSVKSTADSAKASAEEAATTAAAAKIDAENAQKDIDALGDSLTSLSNTMSVDYARKTDLTETEAHLQSQIEQNAAQIETTVSKFQIIDETANDALENAETAKAKAEAAQAEADAARAEAIASQAAADEAQNAADIAKAEAATAQAAADEAQRVADKAEADLVKAQADFETISSRADATETQIARAQAAVNSAQAAVNSAQATVTNAVQAATAAKTAADNAQAEADNAQAEANAAAQTANSARAYADEFKTEAYKAAMVTSSLATYAARDAQETADRAATKATEAVQKAAEAVQTAEQAQADLLAANATNTQAQADLLAAQNALEDILADVSATEAQIAEAQAAVNVAQTAADIAQAEATAAQAFANETQQKATEAQADADTARIAADEAEINAQEAQAAADAALALVEQLAVSVADSQTQIIQNADKLALMATKKEVKQTLGGYYTKEESDAAIEVSADRINSSVNSQIEGLQVGGRNLLKGTKDFSGFYSNRSETEYLIGEDGFTYTNFPVVDALDYRAISSTYSTIKAEDVLGKEVVLSFELRSNTGWTSSGDNIIVGFALCNDASTTRLKYHTAYLLTDIVEDWTRHELKVKLTEAFFENGSGSIWDCTRFYVQIYNHSLNNLQVRKFKLEYGNKGTDWSPAYEDMATSKDLKTYATKTEVAQTANSLSAEITDASKVATDFLQFDENGLQVGNRQSGTWSGYRAQVKPDSFNILDSNGNELATYGANKIELGKNSKETVIELCGGSGEIKAYESGKGVVMEGSEVAQLHAGAFSELKASIVREDGAGGYQVQSGVVQAQSGGSVTIGAQIWESDSNGLPVGTIGDMSQIYINTDYIYMKNDKEVYISSPIVEATGDIQADGNIQANSSIYAGDNVRLYSSTEGGNIQIKSPNGVTWEADAYDDNFRLYSNTNGTNVFPLSINASTGMAYINKGATLGGGITYSGYGRHITWPVTTGKLLLTTNSTGTSLSLPFVETGASGWTKTYLQIVPGTPAMVVGAADVAMTYGGSTHTFGTQITANGGFKLPFGSDKGIEFNGKGKIYSTGNQSLYVRASEELNYSLFLGVIESNWAFCPYKSTYLRLGSPNYKWGQIYSSNATISTSDRNLKKNIEDLTEKHIEFFMMLQPKSFEFKDGTSGRTHVGFIAQEVEEAMEACRLSSLDFAGFCKDQKTERVEKTIEVEREVLKEVPNEAGELVTVTETEIVEETIEETVPVEGEYIYSLRYEEFIALNTFMLQKQQAEIQKMKAEIETLKADIEMIKAAVLK